MTVPCIVNFSPTGSARRKHLFGTVLEQCDTVQQAKPRRQRRQSADVQFKPMNDFLMLLERKAKP